MPPHTVRDRIGRLLFHLWFCFFFLLCRNNQNKKKKITMEMFLSASIVFLFGLQLPNRIRHGFLHAKHSMPETGERFLVVFPVQMNNLTYPHSWQPHPLRKTSLHPFPSLLECYTFEPFWKKASFPPQHATTTLYTPVCNLIKPSRGKSCARFCFFASFPLQFGFS